MTAAALPTLSDVTVATEDEWALAALLNEETPDSWGSLALLLSLPALLWLGLTLAQLL